MKRIMFVMVVVSLLGLAQIKPADKTFNPDVHQAVYKVSAEEATSVETIKI